MQVVTWLERLNPQQQQAVTSPLQNSLIFLYNILKYYNKFKLLIKLLLLMFGIIFKLIIL